MGHQSVLLEESIEALAIKPNGIYIDGTFGRGGHSQAILEKLSKAGRLIAIDKDEAAIAHAAERLSADARFQIFQGSFCQLKELAMQLDIYGKVDGILLDLGLSSPQLDTADRGFSFMLPGPLDMRMDKGQSLDATAFVNKASIEEMVKIFRDYGEERFALRIARAIAEARESSPIVRTDVLAEIVKKANPKWEKHKHPATRVFQAIRIHINNELADLKSVLDQAIEVLGPGGRLVVISFHSLEDRIVKQFMRKEEEGCSLPSSIPIRAEDIKSSFKRIGKAIKPREEEVKSNVRSRSAILRTGEKIA